MKDIYTLLNETDIELGEFEEMEVSDLEKAKVKRRLRASIKSKKKIKVWKINIAAAVIVICCSFTMLAVTSPAYAGRIPVIGDIFKFFDDGRTGGLFDEYKEYSSEINMSQESNGIKVTIKDAIFDGETVFITYSLESEQDLGNDPYLFGRFDIKGSSGGGGGNQISKVDKNNYVGVWKETPHKLKKTDKVNVSWNIESIRNANSEEKLSGSWTFSFSLKALESHTQVVGSSAERDGLKVTVSKMVFTPMSFIVYYDQLVSEEIRNKWDGVDIDIEIKDDLGNLYRGNGNAGSGDREGYNINWSKTFEKLDPNATKLVVTPHVRLYEYTADNHGSLVITREGQQSKVNSLSSKLGKGEEKFVLDDIIIEWKK